MYTYVFCVFELLYLPPLVNCYMLSFIFMFICICCNIFLMLILDKILYVIVIWKKRRSPKQPNRVSRGSPSKTPLHVRKIHVFWGGSLVKFALQGINIKLLGSLQPVDMKNNPRQLIWKKPKSEGKPRTWQHWVEVTHFRLSPALRSQTHLGT